MLGKLRHSTNKPYILVLTAPLLESMHGFLKVDPLEAVLCNDGGRGEVTASDTRRAGDYFTFAGNIPMEKLSVQKKMPLRP